MDDILTFPDRESFRRWLEKNNARDEGVWLLFGKPGGPATLTAGEALEEALCFGWIDGQMQRLSDKTYKKYFCARRANSKWSDKNKTLAAQLAQQGRMTACGQRKIDEAKKDGRWDTPKPPGITEEQTSLLSELLKEYEPARTNYEAMPPSVKKTYTRAYLDAKTDAGREKRLAWLVGRLNKNLKPM